MPRGSGAGVGARGQGGGRRRGPGAGSREGVTGAVGGAAQCVVRAYQGGSSLVSGGGSGLHV